MSEEGKKGRLQKASEVLQKLRAHIWPRKVTTGADVKVAKEKAEDWSDRCQWSIIDKITPETVIKVLYSALPKQNSACRDLPMPVIFTTRGSYHRVFIVKTRNPVSHQQEGWVVKIPGHGTPDRWTTDDEYMLVHEVETIRLVTTYTNVPAAVVVDYSATLNNDFGFPYIVMKELPGKSANDLWYKGHTVASPPETEQKRLNYLRSLARHMTDLDKLRFDQIGMPIFDVHSKGFKGYANIKEERLPVGKYYVWPCHDSYRSVQHGPFASTQDYTRTALKNLDGLTDTELDFMTDSVLRGTLNEAKVQSIGTAKFLSIILSHPVFQSTPNSTFALRHSDLDLQNTLIDDDGNIIGIIDWDASLAAPRCVAHASVPAFLDLDFYPGALIRSPFLYLRAAHYRSIYAAALVEAGNPDAQYTTKSHVYQAVLVALHDGGNKEDLFERLLKETGLQVNVWEAKYLLTIGDRTTEILKNKLWKVLDPEMPAEDMLQRVEQQNRADAAALAWMNEFLGLNA